MAVTDTMTPLERQFHDETLAGCRELQRKHKYNPTYFLQMVHEHGGAEAVRILMKSPNFQAGLTTLWEINQLDMSCEAQVLDPRYASLFTDTEKREAKRRLAKLNYSPKYR